MRKVYLLLVTIMGIFIKPITAQTPWPQFVFQHWVWEDESTQQSALQLVADYKAHNIPVGAIIIDSPWETGYNTFQWDTSLFPNAQAMVDSFHAQNVKVIVWTTTAINTDVPDLWHYGDSMHFFMQANAGSGSAIIHWWKGDGSMIDFFNPAAVAWWKTLMDKTLDLGIDGWKCDGTDYSIFLAGATYSPGAGANVARLAYSEAYYRLFHNYTRQRLGNDRANMSRPIDNYGYTFITDPNLVSFTPRDIGFACWVGDQDATFAGMKNALNNMYQSDANNYLAFGSDIGGYRDQNVPNGRDNDLFIRWAQLGAFSPLMENGGGGEHRPWIFNDATNDVYKMFARLHHAMVPYLMQQGDSLFALSKSLMQFFNSTDYRYMLGSDVYVAPVLSSSNTISISTFPGTGTSWVYLFDNSQVFQSGANATLTVPYEQYPVFIKSTSPLLGVLDSVVASVTGLQTLRAENHSINIYPNPAINEIGVAGLDFKAAEEYEVRLYDVLGRVLLKTHLSHGNTSVSVEGLENGVYSYTIGETASQASVIKSGKLVIQK
jgi:alpha-glucosidase (family GH31 glycosyl hydrolase)